MLDILVTTVLVLAALPLVLGLINLCFYRPLPAVDSIENAPKLSVLIPARNEEARITPVLEAVVASRGADFELVVADDASTDRTPEIVAGFAARDPRVRMIETPPLPEGWGGKNNACFALSKAARNDVFVFIDSDVKLAPDALARVAAQMARRPDIALLTGFPYQITGTFWEKLTIPLIHLLLLGYLPFIGERFTNKVSFGAGCGMLMVVRREAYEATGGHQGIRASRHDGVTLPRLFRRNGLRTYVFDATALISTRMYDNVADLWEGFSKNAHEAMATWTALPVWTALLGGGHIAPLLLVLALWAAGIGGEPMRDALLALACAYGFRVVLALRFRQSWLGVALHPLGVAFLLALQWIALIRHSRGQRTSWRGREYEHSSGTGKEM